MKLKYAEGKKLRRKIQNIYCRIRLEKRLKSTNGVCDASIP